jgi:hypothetical protein
MSTKDIVGWIIGIILIILALYVVFYVWNPSTDATTGGAVIVGGGYLLRKYMKNKKSHKNRK